MKNHHFVLGIIVATAISLMLIIGCSSNPTGGVGGGGGTAIYTLGITVTPESWGTVEVSPTGEVTVQGTREYASGTVVTITIEGTSGHIFDHWGGDLSTLESNPVTIEINGNKNIIASLQHIYYHLSISVSPNGWGTVEPYGGTYIYGETAVLTAETAIQTNYLFSSWEGDASGISGTTTVLMTGGDKHVTADFKLHYTDNGDGTITDNITGLMWVKDPSQIPGGPWGSSGSPANMLFADATGSCDALVYAGHDDWRLSTITELQSIVDSDYPSPSIYQPYFPNTQTTYYWSSTLSPYVSSGQYLVIDFSNGTVHGDSGNIGNLAVSPYYYVRPVRGP